MINLVKTDATNPDFIELVSHLDKFLAIIDGEEHAFYDTYNKLHDIKHVVLAYQNDKALGCGAFKEFEPGIAEIKRMFVLPEARGKGIAKSILQALEIWSKEAGFQTCILETGHKQVEAIKLYTSQGYRITENYGQYAGVENSICMRKEN